jgi:hypothetical protein
MESTMTCCPPTRVIDSKQKNIITIHGSLSAQFSSIQNTAVSFEDFSGKYGATQFQDALGKFQTS